jgi:hypothetical protein
MLSPLIDGKTSHRVRSRNHAALRAVITVRGVRRIEAETIRPGGAGPTRAIALGLVALTATAGCSRASDSWLWREIRDRTVGWPVEDTVPKPTLSDAAVTSAVKARLAADPGSDFTRVTVDTKHGRVVLMGLVNTWGEWLRAEQLALGTTGSIGVVNQLQVEPPSRP